MDRKPIVLMVLVLTLAALACNAPTPALTPDPTPMVTPFVPPEDETTVPPTVAPDTPEPPPPATQPSTPPPSPSPSPSPTSSPTPTATTQPVSEGPLDFTIPTTLSSYTALGGDRWRATLLIDIRGGAAPFTVRHDLATFQTSLRRYPLVFEHGGCGAIVHTITIQSADGQRVVRDYWIPAPWCITPSS